MLRAVIIITFAFFSTACSQQSSSYFPLTKGYQWHYDVTKTTLNGIQKQKYILRNLGKNQINNTPVYVRSSLDGTTFYYNISDNGIFYLGRSDGGKTKPEFNEEKQIVMYKPFSVNTTWEQLTTTKLLKKSQFAVHAKVLLNAKIESLHEVVNVPAGRFERCMKITMSGSTFKDVGNYIGLTLINVEQTNWYSPGVGLVKMERVETTQSETLSKGSLSIALAKYYSG